MNIWITAFALALLIEGILPFVTPQAWRELFRKLTAMTDGQIRFAGLTAMIIGLTLLYLAK